MNEIWAKSLTFPHYEVSSLGRVRRAVKVRGKTGNQIKPWLDNGYPTIKLRREGKTVKAYIHRLIAEVFHALPPYLEVDHRYHDKTNVEQIRPATRAQNCWNTRGNRAASSKYKGVSWLSDRKLWYACIRLDGKTKSLGRYARETDAAIAYDKAAYTAWGEFAFLNFPGNETDKFGTAA